MNVDFKGFNENVATFVADESVEAGKLVTMSEDYTVKACENNNEIVGLCLSVRDGYAAVQIAGYIEVNSTSSIAKGYRTFVAYGNDSVTPGDSARAYLVVKCANGKIGFIL